jgi:hypothetical protein
MEGRVRYRVSELLPEAQLSAASYTNLIVRPLGRNTARGYDGAEHRLQHPPFGISPCPSITLPAR